MLYADASHHPEYVHPPEALPNHSLVRCLTIHPSACARSRPQEIRYLVHEAMRHAAASFGVAERLLEPFWEHRQLWTADIAAELRHFIEANRGGADGGARTAGGESAAGGEGMADSGLPPSPGGTDAASAKAMRGAIMSRHRTDAQRAAVDVFARQREEPALPVLQQALAEKQAKADEVTAMPVTSVRGWLKFDAKPAKQALTTWVSKWKFAYTNRLKENVEACLEAIAGFSADVRAGLESSAAPDALSEVELTAAMAHIHAVMEVDSDVDELFEPLRGTVSLLRRYNIHLADETVEALDHAPYEWEDIKKLVEAASSQLLERKAAQGEKVKSDAERFTERVAAFRADFKALAPFAHEVGTEDAYAQIDEWCERIRDIERQADELRSLELLFDLRTHAWKELKSCDAELLHLKLIWDHATLIEHTFASWEATPWALVDCDGCYGHAKRLQAQVLALEKRVRAAPSWGAYVGMAKGLSDMLATLPLVQDLRDDAMRDRHWKKLMRICGKTFVLDDKFCLRDLLRLQLHLFAEAVGDIVEQSRQEIKIDKALTKIEVTWVNLSLEYTLFKNSGVKVLVEASLGPIYESLDEHEAALQAMMGNRFVGFFESAVSSWRSKLGNVRATLDAWIEVQRQWCSLESIFLGSEDIREQLPDDAKRFDGIDGTFREQMADSPASPIDACMREGRMEALHTCQAALELCSRALSDYLETKRKKFPRFYFISAGASSAQPPPSSFSSPPLALSLLSGSESPHPSPSPCPPHCLPLTPPSTVTPPSLPCFLAPPSARSRSHRHPEQGQVPARRNGAPMLAWARDMRKGVHAHAHACARTHPQHTDARAPNTWVHAELCVRSCGPLLRSHPKKTGALLQVHR